AHSEVVKENRGTQRRHTGFVGVGDQHREVPAGQHLYRRRSFRGRHPRESDKRRQQVQMTCEGCGCGTGLGGGARDDQRHVRIFFVGEWPLAFRPPWAPPISPWSAVKTTTVSRHKSISFSVSTICWRLRSLSRMVFR